MPSPLHTPKYKFCRARLFSSFFPSFFSSFLSSQLLLVAAQGTKCHCPPITIPLLSLERSWDGAGRISENPCPFPQGGGLARGLPLVAEGPGTGAVPGASFPWGPPTGFHRGHPNTPPCAVQLALLEVKRPATGQDRRVPQQIHLRASPVISGSLLKVSQRGAGHRSPPLPDSLL